MSHKLKKEVQHFDNSLSTRFSALYQDIFRILKESGSTHAGRIHSLLVSGRVHEAYVYADDLVSQKYETASSHYEAHQVANLVRKYVHPASERFFDARGTALQKFLESEQKCKASNDFLRSPYGVCVSYLWKARSYIRYVLGDEPNLGEIYDNCAFGPGASLGIHGNATNLGQKLLADNWTVTPSAFHYARSACKRNPLFWELLLSKEDGDFYSHDQFAFDRAFRAKCQMVNNNKIAFVPKTASTDRTIAVEPLLNTFLQKGIDTVMRHRLRRVGIDLSDQSRNQRYALYGSTGGPDPFSTIDLSSASDSISIELVRWLLPPAWFDILNHCRSPEYSLDGDVRRYEKFCSMGNGFCFPLETLIFSSIVHSCGGGAAKTDYLVYGDDIIVRGSVFDEVCLVLNLFGFDENRKKTFSEGPFRESCGADYFGGEDVRPFILDFRLDSLQNLIKFLNLVNRSERTAWFFREVWIHLFEVIPERLRFVRPEIGSADGAITVSHDYFMSSRFARWSRDLCAWRWTEITSRPRPDKGLREKKGYGTAIMFAALLGAQSSRPFTLRRQTETRTRSVVHS